MFEKLFGDAFGRIAPDCCRMTYNGNLAIKVGNGYRAWNAKTGRLTNVTSFCFDLGQDFVFVIPTTRVHVGDVILHNGQPKAVVQVGENPTIISAINYNNGTVEQIVPERHIFMGKTYFFGKLVSLFGKGMFSGKGTAGIMKMMMLKQFMGGQNATPNDFGQAMLPLMLLSQGNGIEDIFNFGDVDDVELGDAEDDEDDEVEVPVPAKKKATKK